MTVRLDLETGVALTLTTVSATQVQLRTATGAEAETWHDVDGPRDTAID